jgi:DNA polymerase epsilon subunit 2
VHRFHSGVFVENTFVLAEGWYEDGLFHVSFMGFPPLEDFESFRLGRFK